MHEHVCSSFVSTRMHAHLYLFYFSAEIFGQKLNLTPEDGGC
jgi:hypothetical protein